MLRFKILASAVPLIVAAARARGAAAASPFINRVLVGARAVALTQVPFQDRRPMVFGSTWRELGQSHCRSRQAITLPEGNLRSVGYGAGFPDQDAHAWLHATSSLAHFHRPLVHDLLRRLWRCVWIHCRQPIRRFRL